MSRSTAEAVDDTLLANKVTRALYADKQVRGRQMTAEKSTPMQAIARIGSR